MKGRARRLARVAALLLLSTAALASGADSAADAQDIDVTVGTAAALEGGSHARHTVWSQHHFTSDASADADAPRHVSSSQRRRAPGGSGGDASLWALTRAASNYDGGEEPPAPRRSAAVGAALRHRGVPRRLAMMLEPAQALPADEAAAVLAAAAAARRGGGGRGVDGFGSGSGSGSGGGVGIASKLGRAVRAGSSSSSNSSSSSSSSGTPAWALDALAADADPAGEHAACRLHSYLPAEHPSMSPSVGAYHPPTPTSSSSSSSCAEDDAACTAALADAAPGLAPAAAISSSSSSAPLECADGYALQGSACVQRCPAGYGLPTLCADTLTCVRAGAPCPHDARREVPFWCAAPGELVGGCAKQEYESALGGPAAVVPPQLGAAAAEAAAAAGVARPLFGARGSLGRRINMGGGAAAAEEEEERRQAAAAAAEASAAAQEALSASSSGWSSACKPGFAPFEREVSPPAGEDGGQKAQQAATTATTAATTATTTTTCRQRCPTGFLDCGQWCAMPGVACDGTGGQGTSTPAGFLPVTMVGGGSGSRHGGGGVAVSAAVDGSPHYQHHHHNWSSRHSSGPLTAPPPPPPQAVDVILPEQQQQTSRNVSSATAAAAIVLPGRPMPLCKLAVGGCSLAAREQGALKAACAAAGHPTTSACPMSLSLHGGCGGQRLHAASGVRRGATVRRIEAWWGVAGASASAAAEAGASASPSSASSDNASSRSAEDNIAAIDQDAILALRFTYSQGAVQVLGNATLAAAGSPEPPRGALELSPGETIERVRTWRSRTLVDGATLTPVLGGFEILTSRGKRLLAGGGKDAAPGAALRDAAAAAAPRSGRSAMAAAAADDGWVSSSDRTLVLDRGSAGLGTGVMVGAAAYTSPSAIGSLGFLFMRPQQQQQRNGGEL